ncbi:MAG: hypothetical protein A3J69_01740 [Candidatus Levybacteria bacterium RIFCSPHIGHO2_02_FULL_42_12]|nr:MAG: hypothetical protein A2698_00995 [Candidatus Levybacteria bacterium RIFCSPHIGHO2_01_FULL_42_15]OGH33929.1 MAG: hypothetical protein A3J69_01740 [Candidatus Levybacteria bacterium RIFCSPHIGHO2_02_FULL_42_12]OGH43057.1 MAG: hypothetical protein A3B53_02720 [Candidatus Levybacteria bacterium RIFCSPLOWO2_01_FULL_42_15]
MAIFRKRFLYWLIKEYIRRFGKTILLFFAFGILVFFGLRLVFPYFYHKIPVGSREIIGFSGVFTTNTLPQAVLDDVGQGLTSKLDDGTIIPRIASSWKVEDDDKEYVFFLKKGVTFADGFPLTAEDIRYEFKDVTVERKDDYTISFKLKESYAPFLTTVSKPFFKKGFVGVGNYRIKDIQLNGNFVKSIILSSKTNPYVVKKYEFYSTEDALKLAFVLGEIQKARGLPHLGFKDTSISAFKGIVVEQFVDYSKLVSLFYNTQDQVLSDKRLRQGMSYALPSSFSFGERSFVPFPKKLWAYQKSVNEPEEDVDRARVLLEASAVATSSPQIVLELKTLPKYQEAARQVAEAWKRIGIETKIETVDNIPSQFQIFLGDFNVPNDPDQYTLWHSNQDNNITRYKNLRIDKLLEDGRKTINSEERKKIYADFLKYFLDDAPASFLYFPYRYNVTRS